MSPPDTAGQKDTAVVFGVQGWIEGTAMHSPAIRACGKYIFFRQPKSSSGRRALRSEVIEEADQKRGRWGGARA